MRKKEVLAYSLNDSAHANTQSAALSAAEWLRLAEGAGSDAGGYAQKLGDCTRQELAGSPRLNPTEAQLRRLKTTAPRGCLVGCNPRRLPRGTVNPQYLTKEVAELVVVYQSALPTHHGQSDRHAPAFNIRVYLGPIDRPDGQAPSPWGSDELCRRARSRRGGHRSLAWFRGHGWRHLLV
jgi:hypothetical protein